VELARYFHIAGDEGAQTLFLSGSDIVSFCTRVP
jgi:hypothetical protein